MGRWIFALGMAATMAACDKGDDSAGDESDADTESSVGRAGRIEAVTAAPDLRARW